MEDNIKINLEEIDIDMRNLIDSDQDRDCIVLYFIYGVVIAAQCTATFLRSIVLPRI